MIDFIPLQYYTWVYYWLMTCLCVITGLYYLGEPGCKKMLVQNSGLFPIIFVIIITIYIGLRPVSGRYFSDMYMYAHGYKMANTTFENGYFNLRAEWFFELVLKVCRRNSINVNIWFLIVEIFYIGSQVWACKKLLQENLWFAILFVLFSYQFWNFGTNGIRNGMACGLMTLSFAFISERKKSGYWWGIFLALLAMGCHRTVIIPILSLLGSLYVVKKVTPAILIWIACILLSIVAGNFFQNLIMGIGFDDRMTEYAALGTSRFSRSGFRWDFLLYSSMPILLAWYIERKGIRDRTFTLLANTYILANSIWVLVCRVAFSNRIAYLSWFLYALVFAYAVIRVPIWRNQDRMAAWILMAHAGFTIGMHLIGK